MIDLLNISFITVRAFFHICNVRLEHVIIEHSFSCINVSLKVDIIFKIFLVVWLR